MAELPHRHRDHAGVDPMSPTDTPLWQVDATLDAEGYDGPFRARPGGHLQCLTCRSVFAASGQRADRVTRLEGASDPEDMIIVIPLVCPVCGVRGTLIASYGPDATEDEADVLVAFDRTPSKGDGDGPTPGIR